MQIYLCVSVITLFCVKIFYQESLPDVDTTQVPRKVAQEKFKDSQGWPRPGKEFTNS